MAGRAPACCSDLGLDGMLLGDGFGPVGRRDSSAERRAGIARCFARTRDRLGGRLIYMAHGHVPGAAARVPVDARIVPTAEAPPRTAEPPPGSEGPRPLVELGFVDPWHWRRGAWTT